MVDAAALGELRLGEAVFLTKVDDMQRDGEVPMRRQLRRLPFLASVDEPCPPSLCALPGAGSTALGVGHGGIQRHDLRRHPHAECEGELAHGRCGEVALAREHA